MIIILLALAGFAVSFYGFLVEKKLKENPEYKPLCDISDKASCTKPIKSSFGRLSGVSNTILGMAFYATIAMLSLLGFHQLVFVGSCFAVLISIYLAYILYFKIMTLCIICTATYVINAALFIVSLFTL